jgi:hypothetical protein
MRRPSRRDALGGIASAVTLAAVTTPAIAAPAKPMRETGGEPDALGLAEMVRRRAVSPAELLEAAIARAEALNPRLNWLCCKHSGPPSGTAPLLGSGRFVEMLIEHGHGLGHGRGANAK